MHRVLSGYYSDDEPLSSSPSSYSSCDSIDEVVERYRQYRRRVRGLVQSISDLDDSMAINQGTNALRQPQLGFHHIHGANVERKQNNRVARRKESFCKGLAFSNRPISIEENVCIKLTEVATNWSGVLRFGVTNVDPETYRNAPVPKFACPDLTSKSGYWAKALPERFSTQGNMLHFYVNSSGDLIYGINGSWKGIFLCGINTTLPLWIIVDIYGNSVAVEFVEPMNKLWKYRALEEKSRDEELTDVIVASLKKSKKKEKEKSGFKQKKDASEYRTERSRSVSSQPRTGSGISNPSHVSETISTMNNSTIAQLTAPSPVNRNLDQIRFHQFHGRHISLHQDRTVAVRMVQEYTQGYVFTERPVNINEKIVIQIMEVQQLFNGGLAFGVTCCDPATLRSVDLPDNSGDLVEMPQYWVGIQDIALQPGKNTVLSFWITDTAEVKMRKDTGNPHTVLHVDTSVPLYMWFDCYGATQSIKIVGSSRSQSPMRQSSVQPIRVALPNIPTTTVSNRRSEGTVPAALRVDMRTASRTPVDNGTTPTTRMSVDELLGTNLPVGLVPTPSSRAPPIAPRMSRNIPAPPSRPPPPTPTTTAAYTLSPPPAIAPVLPPPSLPMVSSLDSILNREQSSRVSVGPTSALSSPRPSPVPRPAPPSPVATSQQEDLEDIDPSEECTVCMSAKIDAVIYTCGHMCMCYNCAKQTQETQGHCPLCRKPIQDVIKCYKS